MAQILVTGGAGYIGSHTILEMFDQTNFELLSIDNFSNSDDSTYKRIKEISGKEVINHDLNLCDIDSLKKVFSLNKDILGVVHFAAHKSVSESVENPLEYYSNNINSLINLINVCNENKVNNFIFSSSCAVYGNTNVLPVSEETPLGKAESPYGHTKQICEDILKNFCYANPHFKVIALRYFNPAGAHISGLTGELPLGKPSNLIPAITQCAIGNLEELLVHGYDYETRDGSCIRDYIHVSDIANAHLKSLELLLHQKNSFYKVYNLGTGKGVSVLEAINSFEKVSGQKLNYKLGKRRIGDVVEIYANNNLAKTELGWSPVKTIDDIMSTAWNWELKLKNQRNEK